MKTSDFTIEKNIPLQPTKRAKWKNPRKFPFKDMVIGDSFFVDNYSRDKMQGVSNAGRAYFRKMGKYDTMTVTSRKESNGFRVWVIAKKK